MKPLRVAVEFERDVRRMGARGYKIEKLTAMVDLLRAGQPIPKNKRDHPLRGEWKNHRGCHIQGDWVLVYRMTEQELLLARTGWHKDVFDE
jgi:mRNA interferase YafQ